MKACLQYRPDFQDALSTHKPGVSDKINVHVHRNQCCEGISEYSECSRKPTPERIFERWQNIRIFDFSRIRAVLLYYAAPNMISSVVLRIRGIIMF